MHNLLIILGIALAIVAAAFFATCGVENEVIRFTPELLW
jgi:hypothetical protein